MFLWQDACYWLGTGRLNSACLWNKECSLTEWEPYTSHLCCWILSVLLVPRVFKFRCYGPAGSHITLQNPLDFVGTLTSFSIKKHVSFIMHSVITKNQQPAFDSKEDGNKIIFSLHAFFDCVETVDAIASNRLVLSSLILPWHKPLYDKNLWKRIRYSMELLKCHGLLFSSKK